MLKFNSIISIFIITWLISLTHFQLSLTSVLTIVGLNIVFAAFIYFNYGIKLLDYIYLILLIVSLLSFENLTIYILGALNAVYLGFQSKSVKKKNKLESLLDERMQKRNRHLVT